MGNQKGPTKTGLIARYLVTGYAQSARWIDQKDHGWNAFTGPADGENRKQLSLLPRIADVEDANHLVPWLLGSQVDLNSASRWVLSGRVHCPYSFDIEHVASQFSFPTVCFDLLPSNFSFK